MRTDELCARIRRVAFIGSATAYTEYGTQVLLDEMNDRLKSVFGDSVISARSGYWLTTAVFAGTVVAGQQRIPPRSANGGVESVEVLINGQYKHLREMSPREAAEWENTGASVAVGSLPVGYWIDGERINYVRAPATGLSTRLRYYLRPSALIPSQSVNSLVFGEYEASDNVLRGLITSSDPVLKTITVNALPYDHVNASNPITGLVMTSGQRIDVVRPAGWFTPGIVSASTSITGLVITCSGLTADDFNYIRAGDYVRVEDQTDWPMLPADFHRLLADATAANILRELDLTDKAEVVSGAASADFVRFAKVIQPRTKSEPKSIRLRPYWAR